MDLRGPTSKGVEEKGKERSRGISESNTILLCAQKLTSMFRWRSLRGGWIIWMRNSEWCRKLVPKIRWSMSEGAVSDFEWWWWFDQSDIRWRACVVTMRWLNRYKVIEVRWLSGIESFVSERNDFIFNSFRNFKPVKRFQNRSDVLEFWSMDNSSKGCKEVKKREWWEGRGGEEGIADPHTFPCLSLPMFVTSLIK